MAVLVDDDHEFKIKEVVSVEGGIVFAGVYLAVYGLWADSHCYYLTDAFIRVVFMPCFLVVAPQLFCEH